MTSTPQPPTEPILTDISDQLENVTQRLENVTQRLENVTQRLDGLGDKVDRFNDRLENYEQGMRWVVQMAFTLLISATVALVVSAITFLLRS
jgi:predicted PurR-regulated permease PerM